MYKITHPLNCGTCSYFKDKLKDPLLTFSLCAVPNCTPRPISNAQFYQTTASGCASHSNTTPTRATHTSPPAPMAEVVWRCCEFLPRAINRKPEDCEMVKAAAKAEREQMIKFFDEIESGIKAYEKENEHQLVRDGCRGVYIPTNTIRRLIAPRKESLRAQQQQGVSER